MSRNLWHRLVGSKSFSPAGSVSDRKKTKFRPTFESLEERLVPAMVKLPPAVITVNTLTDVDDSSITGSTISLRDAIKYSPSGEKVEFASSLDGGTITLSSTLGTLDLAHTLTIDGQTGLTKGITVSGNKAVRVFQIDSGVTASISGLTITNGFARTGGGIYSSGTLTIDGDTFTGNKAVKRGGAIDQSGGTVTAIGCTIRGNTVQDYLNPEIPEGTGGGICDEGGTFTATNCTISGNNADGGGGIGVIGNNASFTA